MLDENTALEGKEIVSDPLTSDIGYDLANAQATALSSLADATRALTTAIEKIPVYVPTVWVNNTEPDIDEDNLNKIEEGIKNATNAVNSSVDAITELAAAVDTINGKINNIRDEIFIKSNNTTSVRITVLNGHQYFGTASANGSNGANGTAPLLFMLEIGYDGTIYRLHQFYPGDPHSTLKITNISNCVFEAQLLNTSNQPTAHFNLWIKQI